MKAICNMDLSIIPECYIDTLLIETLVPPQMRYNHQKGCGTVAKRMKGKFHDKFAVGIVDKDKTKIKYLEKFKLQVEYDNLQLLRHESSDKHHYFILILPAMERWILTNSKQVGISLANFNLPSDLTGLKKVTKKVTSKDDNRFKKLFRTLKNSNSKSVIILSEWIEYLKTKRYDVDLSKLRKITEELSNNPELK